MHDFLIALVFVSMVASPAIVASLPQANLDEDDETAADSLQISSTAATNCG
jgi:hypothetical protein